MIAKRHQEKLWRWDNPWTYDWNAYKRYRGYHEQTHLQIKKAHWPSEEMVTGKSYEAIARKSIFGPVLHVGSWCSGGLFSWVEIYGKQYNFGLITCTVFVIGFSDQDFRISPSGWPRAIPQLRSVYFCSFDIGISFRVTSLRSSLLVGFNYMSCKVGNSSTHCKL